MPIYPAGALNTTALVVPDLYVQIQQPQPALNGVPSDILGVVGTASWGPVNIASVVGSPADYAAQFGPVMNRTYDAGTQVAIAAQQGAANFRVVRVTDGTDVAASKQDNPTTPDITFTARYTGSFGNNIVVSLVAGGATGSWTAQVACPGLPSEAFTNITGSGNAFWVNVANAINNGQGALRGPSHLITATAGAGTAAAAAASYTLAGGTDGATTITTTTLVGADTAPRTGMYALRGQNCAVMLLADGTGTTEWSTVAGYALSIGAYAILPLPAGTSVATAVSDVQTVGVDSYGVKIMHGDWLYWNDQTNGLLRLVSPAAFAAGVIVAQDPSQSSLNKPLYGIAGSQTQGVVGTSQFATYASADLADLFSAGIDVICLPQPGGPYWGVRGGINSSLNAAVNGDNYTRMTNYIAATLNAGMGQFVGRKITPTMDQQATAAITGFLSNLQTQGLLGATTGPLPAVVQGGLGPNTPNPQSRTALGYYQINVAITYAAINRFFIVNLQGGQTVVTSQPLSA